MSGTSSDQNQSDDGANRTPRVPRSRRVGASRTILLDLLAHALEQHWTAADAEDDEGRRRLV